MELKNDPRHYSWEYIYQELKKNFPDRQSLPALSKEMLQGAFRRIAWDDEPTPEAASTSQAGASAPVPNEPVSGSFGISQAGYNTMYAAPQSYPGSSYGAPQLNPSGAFGAPLSGPRAQYAPSQLGLGGSYAPTPGANPQLPPLASFNPGYNQAGGYGQPYAAVPNTSQQLQPRNQGYGYHHQYGYTPNTNPQLPPAASFDPAWRQNCGYGGRYASPPNTNQQLPPVASFDPAWNQGHTYGGPHAMTPGMERGPLSYQAGDSDSHDQFVHRDPLAGFSEQQRKWIWDKGLCICPGYGWKEIVREYWEHFDCDEPDYHTLRQAFNAMRKG